MPVVAEQVINVPKVILENIHSRSLCREPQLAEQLAEVSMILTPSFLRMLQNVDTPVPHGGRGALVVVELLKVFKAFSLNVFLPLLWSRSSFSVASVEQIVDFPVSGGGLQDLRPGQSSASSSHSPADFDAFQWGFSHFSPKQKQCDRTSALWVGTASALEPMDAGCL